MQCAECGFDDADWEPRDIARLLTQRRGWWAAVAGSSVDPALAPLAAEVDRVDDVHGLTHLLWRAGRVLYAGTPEAAGVVVQLSTSGGGVPKTAVPSAVVGRRGLVGDVQRSRKHHGSPPQALCLWSADLIDALVAQGHPLGYGCAGENVTVRGLPWGQVLPGKVITIGAVRAELTSWAVPCGKNRQWFRGGAIEVMGQDTHPGWSRVYARVLTGGTVTVGDAVLLEPAAGRG